jgi:hypothetical protein
MVPAEPAGVGEKKHKKGTPSPKFHQSPHHLLDPLAPPGSKVTLSTVDRRWKVGWTAQSTCAEWLVKPWSQASYSKVFNSSNWQVMLEDVHTYAWQKWKFASAEQAFSLKGRPEQVPGKLDKKSVQDLAEWVANLPPITKKAKLETQEAEG